MDEQNLRNLFQDAPGEAPPSGFDLGDVTSASQRATARHRVRMATASTAAVLVLAGGGLFAALGPFSGGETGGNSGNVEGDVAAAPQMEPRREGQPFGTEERPQDGGSGQDQGSAKQGVESPSRSAPTAARTARCETVDRRLATALAGELPVDPQSDAIAGQLGCDEGRKQAAYRVPEGTVTVALDPNDTQLTEESSEVSGVRVTAETASGQLITLYSRGVDGKPNPYADQLQEIADAIAAGLP